MRVNNPVTVMVAPPAPFGEEAVRRQMPPLGRVTVTIVDPTPLTTPPGHDAEAVIVLEVPPEGVKRNLAGLVLPERGAESGSSIMKRPVGPRPYPANTSYNSCENGSVEVPMQNRATPS